MRRERRLTKIILPTTTSRQDSGLLDVLIICLQAHASIEGHGPMSVLAWN